MLGLGPGPGNEDAGLKSSGTIHSNDHPSPLRMYKPSYTRFASHGRNPLETWAVPRMKMRYNPVFSDSCLPKRIIRQGAVSPASDGQLMIQYPAAPCEGNRTDCRLDLVILRPRQPSLAVLRTIAASSVQRRHCLFHLRCHSRPLMSSDL